MTISMQRWDDNSYIALSSLPSGGYMIDCRIARKTIGPAYYHYEHKELDKAIHHMATLIRITQKFHGIGKPIYY